MGSSSQDQPLGIEGSFVLGGLPFLHWSRYRSCFSVWNDLFNVTKLAGFLLTDVKDRSCIWSRQIPVILALRESLLDVMKLAGSADWESLRDLEVFLLSWKSCTILQDHDEIGIRRCLLYFFLKSRWILTTLFKKILRRTRTRRWEFCRIPEGSLMVLMGLSQKPVERPKKILVRLKNP